MLESRMIKPRLKVEDYTHCIPRYKEWEEKYVRIIKPWSKVEDYTYCTPRYKECKEKYARNIKPRLKVKDYTYCTPRYKSIRVASSGAYNLKVNFETAAITINMTSFGFNDLLKKKF